LSIVCKTLQQDKLKLKSYIKLGSGKETREEKRKNCFFCKQRVSQTDKIRLTIVEKINLLVSFHIVVDANFIFCINCQPVLDKLVNSGDIGANLTTLAEPQELLKNLQVMLKSNLLRKQITFFFQKRKTKLMQFLQSTIPEQEFYYFVKLSPKNFNSLVSFIFDKLTMDHTINSKVSVFLDQTEETITFKVSRVVIWLSMLLLSMMCVIGFEYQILVHYLGCSQPFIRKYWKIGICLSKHWFTQHFLSSEYWTSERLKEHPSVYKYFFSRFVNLQHCLGLKNITLS